MPDLELPHRYQRVSALGKGGGGEVWAVRDRFSGETLALKVLAEGATEHELNALVREAVALSGLEGFGLPRVIRFGRLPESRRPYMVRELVPGESLEALVQRGASLSECLTALAFAADQLTVLHRANLLHGDIKPANIIVQGGTARLVDLGLAAPFRDSGVHAEGLTPRYAAPELFAARPLTVRAEVYALGVILTELLAQCPNQNPALEHRELWGVATRATSSTPEARHPSADEFASALRHAAKMEPTAGIQRSDAAWPIVGIDFVFDELLETVRLLDAGSVLKVGGPTGAGRSVLLRRLAWTLGTQGDSAVWVDAALANAPEALKAELNAAAAAGAVTVLVDDADAVPQAVHSQFTRALSGGARVVLVGEAAFASPSHSYEIPALDRSAAAELVRRAVPSLPERMVERVLETTGQRPGPLRELVKRIADTAVASPKDLEDLLADHQATRDTEPLEHARRALERGRFIEAASALSRVQATTDEETLERAVLEARLDLGVGRPAQALEGLRAVETLAAEQRKSVLGAAFQVCLARAHIGVAEYPKATELLREFESESDLLRVEALAYEGMARSFMGDPKAQAVLERAVTLSEATGSDRMQALALAAQAAVLQRADHGELARATYERALHSAERAEDAGLLASVRLNLAGLCKMQGDVAAAIQHFEAAVDMGNRSGRRSAVRQALLNLANTDLYLGRVARARSSVEQLVLQRDQLPKMLAAQLTGLEAELAARSGEAELAIERYRACAEQYAALGCRVDAAEARLEGALLAARTRRCSVATLRDELTQAEQELGEAAAHRSLLLLARAQLSVLSQEDAEARQLFGQAVRHAKESGQPEWVWRALESRAELEESGGQSMMARRDREEALAVLEEIAAGLPRDLREVYWDDPRRRRLRESVRAIASGVSESLGARRVNASSASSDTLTSRGPLVSVTHTALEQRLVRILEINSELAGELDLERLCNRVLSHALELLRAERGFLLMRSTSGALKVHSSQVRGTDAAPDEDFSRSIAESVLRTKEATVSVSVPNDHRFSSYASVHQLMLKSVACVAILTPSGGAIGALYLENRLRPGPHFESELPMLKAFADQVAIALENARLISENQRRVEELGRANQELASAQQRLKELLGERTQKLKLARRKLRDARDTLYSHFGYQNLVGTSAAMRRVYALIERVKDTDVPVLITGESGTGKEVVAKAIHAASERAKAKFLGVNCGAIPEQILESELFGHTRGAFTGADRERKGLFREAAGGSILLDEVGETPPKMQAGLLRVLQERRVRPVGGVQEEPVDVRVIFATNRDLSELVQAGHFREDLFYRIMVVELHLPPLRERREDIPQLVDHFLGLFAARYRRERKGVTREAMRALMAYSWPGNIRQLEHVLLNAWVLSEEPELDLRDFDLPQDKAIAPAAVPPAAAHGSSERVRSHKSEHKRRTISQHRRDERERILQALEACNWNRVKAAEFSGIPRRTFYRRLREYGIQ